MLLLFVAWLPEVFVCIPGRAVHEDKLGIRVTHLHGHTAVFSHKDLPMTKADNGVCYYGVRNNDTSPRLQHLYRAIVLYTSRHGR